MSLIRKICSRDYCLFNPAESHFSWELWLLALMRTGNQGQVLSINPDEVLIHWWGLIKYSPWKLCFESGEPYKKIIPKNNIVHCFKWREADSGNKWHCPKDLKQKYLPSTLNYQPRILNQKRYLYIVFQCVRIYWWNYALHNKMYNCTFVIIEH